MSIKTKMFLIVFALFGILGGINFFIQRFIVFPSFLELEEQETAENIRRITHALNREVIHLDRLCRDWAVWDDLYDFTTTRSDGFVASNLGDTTMESAQLSVLLICDVRGNLIWGKALDPETGSSLPLTPDSSLLAEILDKDGTLSGAVATDLGPLLFASQKILRSDGSGPGQGFILMGRLINETLLVSLREQIRIPFEISYPYATAPEDCDQGLGNQSRNDALSFFLLRESGFGKACAFYPDMTGQPLFGIQYRVPREITRKGQDNVRYAAGLIGGSGVLVLGILLVLIQHVIICPLQLLTKHAAMLEKDNDLSRRLELNRSDEIGGLAASFDALVRALGERTRELQEANRQLTQISTQDGLTGIPNRRHFDSHLHEEWRRAMREQQSLSIILIDVDHFKKYNDTYGHQQGDRCLIAIAATIHQCMQRPMDLAARYGGEEFAAILPNTGATGAMYIAEKIRLAVQDLNIEHAAVDGHVTISLGVASMIPTTARQDCPTSELIKIADQALYQAKNQGRNRSVLGRPDSTANADHSVTI